MGDVWRFGTLLDGKGLFFCFGSVFKMVNIPQPTGIIVLMSVGGVRDSIQEFKMLDNSDSKRTINALKKNARVWL